VSNAHPHIRGDLAFSKGGLSYGSKEITGIVNGALGMMQAKKAGGPEKQNE
jgi:hypothetical protein